MLEVAAHPVRRWLEALYGSRLDAVAGSAAGTEEQDEEGSAGAPAGSGRPVVVLHCVRCGCWEAARARLVHTRPGPASPPAATPPQPAALGRPRPPLACSCCDRAWTSRPPHSSWRPRRRTRPHSECPTSAGGSPRWEGAGVHPPPLLSVLRTAGLAVGGFAMPVLVLLQRKACCPPACRCCAGGAGGRPSRPHAGHAPADRPGCGGAGGCAQGALGMRCSAARLKNSFVSESSSLA